VITNEISGSIIYLPVNINVDIPVQPLNITSDIQWLAIEYHYSILLFYYAFSRNVTAYRIKQRWRLLYYVGSEVWHELLCFIGSHIQSSIWATIKQESKIPTFMQLDSGIFEE